MSEEDEPSPTQMGSNSSRRYSWCIVFHYDVNDEFPFSVIKLEKFKGTDFPFDLITGHLGLADRLKPRNLPKFRGQIHCIFAKVEKGKFFISNIKCAAFILTASNTSKKNSTIAVVFDRVN